MNAFVPRMGRRCAAGRNFDRWPGAHRDVSTLSPRTRRRLVLERDAVAAARAANGPEASEKFVQEAIWRGYFKGWLEQRPAVWASYRGGLARDAADLADDARGLETEEPDGLPPVTPLRAPRAPDPSVPTALLITEEDCRVEDFDPRALDIRAAASLAASHLRSPRPVSGDVAAFEAQAVGDSAARAGGPAEGVRAGAADDLARRAARAGARQIVTANVPEHPLRDWLRQAGPARETQGIALCEWRRDRDAAIRPHATGGFFKVRKKIPEILQETGLV